MKLFIALSILAITVPTLIAQSCPAYQCAASTITQYSTNDNTNCFTQAANTINIQGCYPSYQCNLLAPSGATNFIPFFTQSLSLSNQETQSTNQYCYLSICKPQQLNNQAQCYRNNDCASRYCLNGTCQLLASGASCANNQFACPAGQSCQNNACQSWILAGATCTANNANLCVPGTACIQLSGQQTSTCTLAFSLGLNQGFTLTPTSQNVFTQSYLCASGYYNATGNTCATLTSSLNPPLKCTNSSTCLPQGQTTNIAGSPYGVCTCANTWDASGQAYCTGQPGDQLYTSLWSTNKQNAQAVQSSITNYAQYQQYLSCSPVAQPTWTLQTQVSYGVAQSSSIFPNNYNTAAQPVTTNNNVITCTKYNTTSTLFAGANNANNQCVNYDNTTQTVSFSLTACPPQYYCQIQTSYTTTPTIPYTCTESVCPFTAQTIQNWNLVTNNQICQRNGPWQGYLDVGQICFLASPSDCITGNCVTSSGSKAGQGVCQVIQVGQPCNSTSMNGCVAGAFCTSGTCQNYLGINAICNSSSYQLCQPNTQCAQLNNNTQYQCTQVYSQSGGTVIKGMIIAGGTTVTSTTTSANTILGKLCQSYSYNTTTNQCNSAMETTLGGWPKNCTSDSQCNSIYGTAGKCMCQPNTQGLQYCQGFSADYMNYYSAYRNYYNNMRSAQNINYQTCALYQTLVQYQSNSCNNFNLNYGTNPYPTANISIVPSQFQPSCYQQLVWGYNIYVPQAITKSSATLQFVLSILLIAISMILI